MRTGNTWLYAGLGVLLAAAVGCEDGGESESAAKQELAEKAKQAANKAEQAAEDIEKAADKMKKGKGHKLTKKQIKKKRKELVKSAQSESRIKIKQEAGKVVYWVTPGPRELEKAVFGTPDKPKRTAEVPEGAPKPVKKIVEKIPFLIGVPEKMRVEKKGKYMTKVPTPFGDKGVPISGDKNGSMEITFIDRQDKDGDGHPMVTADDVKAKIAFKDPKGNEYELRPKMTVQPPIPGYQTQGGVMLEDHHHGDTGTGSPLMPKVYTHAAFWALGDVVVNGKVKNKMQLIHCMMTQTVRNKDYELVFTKDLPLDKENTIAQQPHHTHCVALPIKGTPEGPVHEKVHTAFAPKGKRQPFIHIMFEKDKVVEGPKFELPDESSGGNKKAGSNDKGAGMKKKAGSNDKGAGMEKKAGSKEKAAGSQ